MKPYTFCGKIDRSDRLKFARESLEMETALNDKTATFVHTFRVGEHTVTMTLTRRRFRASRITSQWTPTKPKRLTKEEKHQYRSGRAAAVADAFAS